MSLAKFRLTTMIRCKDMNLQKRFYSEVLGLKIEKTLPGGEITLQAGQGTQLGLYPGEAPKAEHTLACFMVDDIEGVVKDLKQKGVKLMDYDFPGFKTVNHIATMGDHKAAWFQDPEGNYLGVAQQMK
jgi:predicted enzyme related to lactoylglutathione lyase